MAEYVHQRTEAMLPQLEQMQRVGILSNHEIKSVVKKRTNFEYKIVRRTKQKQDFLAYAQYEINLLALIKKRRKEIKYYYKKDEIEYNIVSNIHRLFNICTMTWPKDTKLWISHASFCIKWSKKTQLSKLCTKFTQLHGNKPDVWITCAKWEMECGLSHEKSRILFIHGLKLHPDNIKLWAEYFRFELLAAEKLHQFAEEYKEKNMDFNPTATDQLLLSGEAAKICYKNAVATNPGCYQLIVKFISILKLFLNTTTFAQAIRDYVTDDVMTNYKSVACLRSALAQLQINTASGASISDQLKADSSCWLAYEESLSDVTDRCQLLQEYIDTIITNSESSSNQRHEQSIITSRLNQLVKVTRLCAARKESAITPPICKRIVAVLTSQHRVEDAINIIDAVCDSYQDPHFRIIHLNLHIKVDSNFTDVTKLFFDMKNHVSSLPTADQESFWMQWLQFSCGINNWDLANDIALSHSKSQNKDAVSKMRVLYLESLLVKHGANHAYKVYKDNFDTFCCTREGCSAVLTLFEGCMMSQSDVMADVYNSMVGVHGKVDCDLWLKYINWERTRKDGNVGQLYWRAMRMLDSSLAEEFNTKYTLSQTLS